jgi:hypothetical protein
MFALTFASLVWLTVAFVLIVFLIFSAILLFHWYRYAISFSVRNTVILIYGVIAVSFFGLIVSSAFALT